MASFNLLFDNAVEKDLAKIPKTDVRSIMLKTTKLADDPRPPQSLKLENSDMTYRLRVGNYRVIYQIRHRKDVYRFIWNPQHSVFPIHPKAKKWGGKGVASGPETTPQVTAQVTEFCLVPRSAKEIMLEDLPRQLFKASDRSGNIGAHHPRQTH